MSIASFIRNIVPSFGKKDVREKLRTIGSKLSDIVIPTLDTVADELNERQFKSSYGKEFTDSFIKFLPNHLKNDSTPYIKVMKQSSANASKLKDLLEEYVGSHMGESIHIEGLTYQKATVLRLIELLDFFVDYSSRHLAFLVASETNIEAFDKPDANPYTKAESAYLVSQQGPYFRILELLYEDPKKALSAVEKIPEVLLSGTEAGEVPALAGAAADPLHLSLIPGLSYIFYQIGIRIVDWEIDRYERCKKEKRTVELRLEALRQRRNGKVDARTETIIANYERDLTLLRSKIAQMEERSR